jgi:hypothetical protein
LLPHLVVLVVTAMWIELMNLRPVSLLVAACGAGVLGQALRRREPDGGSLLGKLALAKTVVNVTHG